MINIVWRMSKWASSDASTHKNILEIFRKKEKKKKKLNNYLSLISILTIF